MPTPFCFFKRGWAFFQVREILNLMTLSPASRFLGRDTISKPAEALCPKVSLVLPPRSDWNSVSADFQHDRSPGHIRVTEKFFASGNSHFEVHSIGEYAVFRLPDSNIPHNATGEVKGSQSRIDFLLHKIIPLATKIYQPCTVLQTALNL